MKKLFFLAILISSISFAQENTDNTRLAKHEISVNLLTTIFSKFPMASYEYINSDGLGYGGRVGFSLNGKKDEDFLKFQITPFARWYFLGNGNETVYGRRFFIEANASLLNYSIDNALEYSYTTDAGAGMSVGYKYVNSSNWIGIVYCGSGRLFSDKHDVSFYPQFGINIGKRF